eukprot:2129123-Amphidinium_carterae.1
MASAKMATVPWNGTFNMHTNATSTWKKGEEHIAERVLSTSSTIKMVRLPFGQHKGRPKQGDTVPANTVAKIEERRMP